MGVKITRELHAEVCESLKTLGIVSVAKKHNLSLKTVYRIRNGKNFVGYRRELSKDHFDQELNSLQRKQQVYIKTPIVYPMVKRINFIDWVMGRFKKIKGDV